MRTAKLVLALAACTAPLFAQHEDADPKPPQTLAVQAKAGLATAKANRAEAKCIRFA